VAQCPCGDGLLCCDRHHPHPGHHRPGAQTRALVLAAPCKARFVGPGWPARAASAATHHHLGPAWAARRRDPAPEPDQPLHWSGDVPDRRLGGLGARTGSRRMAPHLRRHPARCGSDGVWCGLSGFAKVVHLSSLRATDAPYPPATPLGAEASGRLVRRWPLPGGLCLGRERSGARRRSGMHTLLALPPAHLGRLYGACHRERPRWRHGFQLVHASWLQRVPNVDVAARRCHSPADVATHRRGRCDAIGRTAQPDGAGRGDG